MIAPQVAVERSPYRLGTASMTQLIGVHPKLVAVVRRAIELTDQDFRVTDGIRTLSEQRRLLAAEKSWTLKSKHLPQSDGYGHAVDLVPWSNQSLSWSWPLCLRVAASMSATALEQDLDLRWGGVWDKPFSACGQTPDELRASVSAYVRRRRQARLRAAIDGPHFELI